MDFQGLSLTRTSGKMSFVPLPALMDKGNWPSLSVSDVVVQGLRNTLSAGGRNDSTWEGVGMWLW